MNEYGRQSAERVLDDLPVGVWVARAAGGEILYTNPALSVMLGLEPNAAQGLDPYRFEDRQGKPYAAENLPVARAVAQRRPIVVDDLVIRRGDGQRVWVRAVANPVSDEGGAVSHVVVAFTDITTEVRALVERAELERDLEVAVHHAPVLLFMLDRQGVLTAAHGALRPFLEQGGHRIVGSSILDAYKDHPTVPGCVRRALAGETVSYSIEVRGLSLDVWLGPMRDAANELAGAIGVCTDVTEGRRAQLRLIQDDRIRAMGTVAASVAHEINNPLTYVLAGLEEAQGEIERVTTELAALAPAGADARAVAAARAGLGRLHEQLGPILEGTLRIREVTRELRALTRPDDEHLTALDVGDVVRSVLKLVRKEIEARASLVEQLGVSPPILANEARMVQVLTNLLINAWQALPKADPGRHVIGVRTGTHGTEALIEIWDSGPGIPPQRREDVFEPFTTTKNVGDGTGLGLFVCRNIVNALRGTITVHDGPGGGALFRVVLPATSRALEPAPPPPAAERRAEAPLRRLRILIIDDDALVGRALAARLRPIAADVRVLVEGRQGLEVLLADDGFDLVYCDVMMKDFSGLDLHEGLRRQAPDRLPNVVFMTGGAFTPEARAFLDQRPDKYVQKPFDIASDVRRRVGVEPS